MFIKLTPLSVVRKNRFVTFLLVGILCLSLASFTPARDVGPPTDSSVILNTPVFTSPGVAVFYENGTGTVLDVNANDGDGGQPDVNIGYTLSGDDAALFNINDQGILTFISSPDYDALSDADKDNLFRLTIIADNGETSNNIATQQITIILIPLLEEGLNTSEQIGSSIQGIRDSDNFGYRLSINADGTVVAASGGLYASGVVRVYQWNGTTWNAKGSELSGEAANDVFGASTSLSYDGNTLAVGSIYNDGTATDAGQVEVFDWDGTNWLQRGEDLNGEAAEDEFGKAVSLSADGNTLAVGSHYNDNNGSENSGQVKVYHWNGMAWAQMGAELEGKGGKGRLGASVSLSADGRVLAAGAPGYTIGFSRFGYTRIYEWTGMEWSQRGADITGESGLDGGGHAVSLSADGTILAIGATLNDEAASNAGHTRVYKWSGASWSQLGSDIDGNERNGFLGTSVSLSADGTALVVGAHGQSDRRGSVYAYQWDGIRWVTKANFIGNGPDDGFGFSTVLSTDGRVMATMGLSNDVWTDNGGNVTTYLLLDRQPIISSASEASFQENGTGTVLDINATDGDGGANDENLTYTLSVGGDNELFSLDEKGILLFRKPPNFEEPLDLNKDNDYELELNLTDGPNTMLQAITVTVTDNTEDPPIFNSVSEALFLENATGTVIDVNANDGDGGADDLTVSYGLEGDDGSVFSIDDDGLLSFKVIPDFDDPKDLDRDNIYNLTVTAEETGTGNVKSSQSVKIVLIPEVEEGFSNGTRIGDDLDGQESVNNFGTAISLNASGDIMAIGAPGSNRAAERAGQVRVFQWNTENWVEMGEPIPGEAAGDNFGSELSLSFDGKVLAVGAALNDSNGENAGHVKVYHWTGTVWQQQGDEFVGVAAGDELGTSVSLNADGTIVAMGSPKRDNTGQNWDDVGEFKTYKWNGTQWYLMGEAVLGGFESGMGNDLQLNELGDRLVVGARSSDDERGYVRVYQWNEWEWELIGNNNNVLVGDAQSDAFGASVTINAVGDIIAVGAPSNDEASQSAGQVKIFVLEDNAWNQIGNDLLGSPTSSSSKFDRLGTYVSLNASGLVLAVGSTGHGGGDSDRGLTEVYEWNGTGWSTKLNALGEAEDDNSGSGLAISADGRVIASGAVNNDGNGDRAGHVRVYSIIDRKPVFDLPESVTFVENSREPVYDVQATDGEGNDNDENVNYSLAVGGDNEFFAISSTGVLTFLYPPNFEEPLDLNKDNSYEVQIVIKDINNSSTNAISVVVTDASVDPPLFVSTEAVTYMENGTDIVIDVNANDGNGGDMDASVTYTLGGADAADFTINASGNLNFVSSPDYDQPIDADEDNIYRLTVTADDGEESNSITTQTLKIIIIPLVEEDLNSSARLGSDINGEAAEDRLGSVIALSADGTVMALGAGQNDGNGSAAGHVRVFGWNGSDWEQMGNDLDGTNSGDEFGHAISLSYDGSVLAVGAPYNDAQGNNSGEVRVYQWDGQNWVERGDRISGAATGDEAGFSLSLNADATMLALGSPKHDNENGDNSGHIRVFEWDGTNWIKRGSALEGRDGSGLGRAVRLDAVGTTLAASGNLYDSNRGYVTIHEWGGLDWVEKGVAIEGEEEGDQYGFSLDMSADGNSVIAGAPFHDLSLYENGGHARVHVWSEGSWTRRSLPITNFTTRNGHMGYSVSMSADGDVVASGVEGYGSSTGEGRAYVYEWVGAWDGHFSSRGDDDDDAMGSGVVLSKDGRVVATGAAFRDSNGNNSGYVLTFLMLNLPPSGLTLSAANIEENSSVGSEVGVLQALSQSLTGSTVFTLVEGEGSGDNDSFAIDGDKLLTNTALDFETKNLYSIRVRADNGSGLTTELAFVVSVTDVNEVPSAFSMTSQVLAENQPAGTKVGDFDITDPDVDESHTILLSAGVGDEDNDDFEISGNALILKGIPDFETKSSYNVRLRVVDSGGLFIEQSLVVSITDVNEAPIALNVDTEIIPENNIAGTVVVNLTTMDQDTGDQHTYSLVTGQGGDDNDAFEVNGSGLLSKNVLDFETKNEYKIRLKTEDQGGLSLEQEFVFNILDQPDPILRLSESPTIPETGKGETSEFDITIFNDGTADLLVQQITYPDAFGGPSGDITVAPSSSQVITVTFSPLEAVVYQGNIEFLTNAGTQLVEVSGEGAIISGVDNGLFSGISVNIYPNPADDLLVIDLSALDRGFPLEISIVNSLGIKQLTKSDFREKLLKLDVSGYHNGLYYIRLTDGNSSAIKKVMIKR